MDQDQESSGGDTSPRYEFILRTWFSRIQKREQFWFAMVVDVWAEHTDNRQAIFTTGLDKGTLSATFFDHSQMFRGAIGVQPFKSTAAMFLDKDVYEGEGASVAIEDCTQRIESLNADFVFKALALVHLEWQPASAGSVCERLLRRRSQINGLMTKEMMMLSARSRSYGFIARDRQVLMREKRCRLSVAAIA